MFLKIEELKHVVIGRIKDAGYNAIQIDCNEWLTLYPQLTDYRIEVISPSGEIYFADTTMQDGIITWKLTARDTLQVGNGQYQVVAVGGSGERKTSSHPKITILEIANGTAADVPPDLSDAWTDTVIRNANAAIDAAEISKQNSEAAIDSANRATALAEEISEATNRAEDAAERAEAAAERAESAGGSGGSAGGIVTETDPTVYDWAKQPQKPTYTADEVNAIGKDALPQAIEAALAQAKESGEFDGAPGLKGDPGADGGYYQPSVTDGVLSWTPSNGDMPSVPASDVRGPAGQDGQPGKDGAPGTPGLPGKTAYQYAQDGGYTGTEAEFAAKLAQEIPEAYTLPVATADRLGGMMPGDGLNVDENGRVSVEPDGEYEVIETIEVTDPVAMISRAFADKYDAIKVIHQCPGLASSPAGLFNLGAPGAGGLVYCTNQLGGTQYTYGFIEVKKQQGTWKVYTGSVSSSMDSAHGSQISTVRETAPSMVDAYSMDELPYLNQLMIRSNTSEIPSGVQFVIKGVKKK